MSGKLDLSVRTNKSAGPRKSRRGVIDRAARRTIEVLEPRVLLSSSESPTGFPTSGNSAALFQSLSAGLNAQVPFDITAFTQNLPLTLPADYTTDMDGLRFYSGSPKSVSQSTVTFGTSDNPTWTMIGLVAPTFTPMLLTYGVTTLNSTVFGSNFIGWTEGLYTLGNQLSSSTNSSPVVNGGFQVQPLDGGLYTDSLLNTGVNYTITSISGPTVTTSTPNTFTAGQQIKFANLTNPRIVGDGSGYFIDTIVSPTQFTIKANDNTDLSEAAATGGTVTFIPSPNDNQNWGALVPNGQQMQLIDNGQRAAHNAFLGFTATRIALTKTTDAVPQPELLFSGVQTVGYKNATLSAGIGFQSANDAKYLEIDYAGRYQLVNANDSSDNELVLTVAVGENALTPRLNLSGIQGGTVTSLTAHGLLENDYIHFTALNMDKRSDGTQPLIKIGQSYQVHVLTPTQFQLLDPVTGETIVDPETNSSTATAVQETLITSIESEDVDVGGNQTVKRIVATTSTAHHLKVGDRIEFGNLEGDTGLVLDYTPYYVVSLVGDGTNFTKFTFATTPDGTFDTDVHVDVTGGHVSVPLFQAGGVLVGGDATLKLSFNGGFTNGTWSSPTDFKAELSGSLALQKDFGNGLVISGLASLKGDGETSEGLVLQSINGQFSVPAWGFSLNGLFTKSDPDANDPTKQNLSFSVNISGLSVSSITDVTDTETVSFNGSATITVASWNWSGTVAFGHGETNGMTLIVPADGKTWVQEFALAVTVDRLKPPDTQNQTQFKDKISILGFIGDVSYNSTGPDDQNFEVGLGGSITLAVGDPTPDANGNWAADTSTVSIMGSADVIKINSNGVHFTGTGSIGFAINGDFKIKTFQVSAKNLTATYTFADPVQGTDSTFVLSGGIALPQLRGAAVQLGNDGSSGGLFVDTTTGKWRIDGWRITIPSFPIGPFVIQNLLLGFVGTDEGNSNPDTSKGFQFELDGQIKFFGGSGLLIGVHIKLGDDDGKFVIEDIGASLRNLNPGLDIPATDAFLTDIGFDIDGLPGSFSFSLLLGAVLGEQVHVGGKDYALVQAIINGEYNDRDIKVTGQINIAGGVFGSATGTLDLNWGTQTYTLDIQGKFIYDVFETHMFLYFSPTIDSGLFTGDVQIPDSVPIVGGHHLLQTDMMFYVDHDSGGDKFFASWFEFLGKWKYGFEYDFAKDKFRFLGTKGIDGLIADLPDGTGPQPYKYNLSYQPESMTPAMLTAGLFDSNESVDSYGLFNVTWNSIDSKDEIAIASGDNSSVVVWGPGAKPNKYGWIDDPNGLVSYMVVSDQSRAGDVIIHAVPTAAFTAPGASYDNPDLYIPFSLDPFNVVLQTTKDQTQSVTNGWTGSFAMPSPELDTLSVTQPQPSNAIGDDQGDDPVTADNATVSFRWRGLDADTTNISLFYDFDNSGYNGTLIQTLSGDQLTVGDPDADGWRTITVPWDIGGLEPGVPIYVYSVIRDDVHAPVKSDYVGQVQSVPAAQIQVTYAGSTSVTPAELLALPLEVTPVTAYTVQSIAAGVATVATIDGLSVGQTFMFSGLTSPVGVATGTPYFITAITGSAFSFSTMAGGSTLTGASSGSGTAYVDQGPSFFYATNNKGLVSPHVDVGQTYRFSMSPTRGVFSAMPVGNQELSWTNDLIQYNTFEGHNQLLRMQYQFKILAAVAGTVYNDFDNNGVLNSYDTGLAGATVYLDDNNNNVLDPGEQAVVTGADGSYVFVHQWAATDTPTSTYTTWVKVIAPAGYNVTATPVVPPTGITFVNDGNPLASLNYYNYQMASPISLSGIVYADANGNGVRDPGENGLAGVSVTITPPVGNPIQAVTDATGAWIATGFARGDYSVSVNAPSGGTITTPTTTITTGSATSIRLLSPFNVSGSYPTTGTTYVWNPATNQYQPWLVAAIAGNTDSTPGLNFFDLSKGTSGTNNAINQSLLVEVPTSIDLFMGKWASDGIPGVAAAFLDNDSVGGEFALSPTTSAGALIWQMLTNSAGERFALSYDPAAPNYSTVASIDGSGNVIRWIYDPTALGATDAPVPFFTRGASLFQFTGGSAVKMMGLNLGASDHFQSQDLAIAYTDEFGRLGVAIWNHATNATQIFSAGGSRLAGMITDDLDGNGLEDVAMLTYDPGSRNYYLTILLTQTNGSMQVLRHRGADLPVAADGSPRTNLAALRVNGGQQALLWTTQDGDSFINAATFNGGPLKVTTVKTAVGGNVVPLTAGSIANPATFAIYGAGPTSNYSVPTVAASLRVDINGNITIDGSLTQYGGVYNGFDTGVTGVTPSASSTTSGVVYNDTNSNGFQDPGEPGLPGITVRLITPTGIVTTTTSNGTDGFAAGSYQFSNVPDNAYLQVVLPSSNTYLAQNPPPGVGTNFNGATVLNTSVAFTGGLVLKSIPFDSQTDDQYTVKIKAGDLQQSGRDNLVIRTSDSLYVQYLAANGSTSFRRYDVSSAAGFFKPELELLDLNHDGRLDIVTSGQSGVDVYINIGLGSFKPFLGILADQLNNTPNGSYTIRGAFTGDDDSGVSTTKTYTHALNFDGSAATVNGVPFTAAGTSGTNFSLQAINTANSVAGSLGELHGVPNNLVGSMNGLASSFYYSFGDSLGGEQLTLSGLTPGVSYTTTFYCVGYGDSIQRQQLVFDSLGGAVLIDENANGAGNGFTFSRTFTATSSSITFSFAPQDDQNSFHQYALTNEIAPAPASDGTPPAASSVFGTEIATIPASAGSPARILAVQQNTGIIHEISWNAALAAPAATGNVFATNHNIIKMDVGDVTGTGAHDLAIYETFNSTNPITSPADVLTQQVWLLSAASFYRDGTMVMDLGSATYDPHVDLLAAQLFTGAESVLVLGNRSDQSAMDLLMYRPGNGLQTTSKAGFKAYELNVGKFIPGSSLPNITVAGENAILVLVPGVNPADSRNPTGFDPNVPLVEAGTTNNSASNVGAVGASIGNHTEELMVLQYLNGTGFVIQPYYNTTDSYNVGSDSGAALYDFSVVVPNSSGGSIAGNVFYDVAATGAWDPTDYGVYDGITVFLDLNNNGTLDSGEPSTFPDRDGNYRFSQLLPKVYPVAIQLGSGYIATSATTRQAVVADEPGARVNGVDFGVKSKDFGADLNNDHLPDLLLTSSSDNKVYVQLRDGPDRLSTYMIGQLPSADWTVAGLYDMTGNGTADVVIHNTVTGDTLAWDLFPGGGVPVVARTVTLGYKVPTGFSVAGIGDLDHDGNPELVIVRKSTREHRLVEFGPGGTVTESPLSVAKFSTVVAVGDLNGDGNSDLILRDSATNRLFVETYRTGKKSPAKLIGRPGDDWSVVGVADMAAGGKPEIIFRDRITGNALAWTLNSKLAVKETTPFDVGNSDGVRLHVEEKRTYGVSGTVIQDLHGTGLPASDNLAMSGVNVRLFVDRNANGKLDAGDGAAVATTVTSADGHYAFSGLSAALYLLQVTTPRGFIRLNQPRAGTFALVLDEGSANITRDVYNFQITKPRVTNVSYQVTHNGTTKTVRSLKGSVSAGDTVKAFFTVPDITSTTLSLASYLAPNAAFSRSRLTEQSLFSADSNTFTSGAHSLQVQVPDDDFQINFVFGDTISQFGAIGTNVSYPDQRRLISTQYARKGRT